MTDDDSRLLQRLRALRERDVEEYRELSSLRDVLNEEATAATRRMNELLVDLHETGWNYSEIARATGVTPSYVRRIVTAPTSQD